MAKGASGKSSTNLLRISGIIFGIGGTLHLLRYVTKDQFILARFQLTYFGSLVVGALLLFLSFSCFWNSRK